MLLSSSGSSLLNFVVKRRPLCLAKACVVASVASVALLSGLKGGSQCVALVWRISVVMWFAPSVFGLSALEFSAPE